MTPQQHSHIVIGGGISGISAAHYATRAGIDSLVLEQDTRIGGCMQTAMFDTLDGFWIEAGSHSCFNSYGNLIDILEPLGLLPLATAKAKQSYALWRGGKRSSIFSALHLAELLRSLPRLFTQSKAGASVAEYYGRGLGRRNYQDLFGPAFRSVICQRADDFPAEALFRKKPRRKDVLRSFTMPEGLQQIPRAIAERSGIEVRTGQGVEAIETAPDSAQPGYILRLSDGSRLGCRHLTLAVPPDVAARLLQPLAPEAAAVISDIGVVEIDSLLLAFPKDALTIPELAGLISVDGPFLSAVSRDFLADPRWRGFAFHFPADTLDDAARVQAACTALDTTPEQAAAIRHTRNRLPSLRKGHGQRLQALDTSLQGSRIGVTGNWFLGVSIEDCVTRSRQEHVRRFGDDLPRRQ
ncbi:NAD(P)-binding protein [Thiohalocapsa marina]|uniref:NAD(P)-binding protein n=1 Tax=Thiohalocapsa marina TaxID=424902 RepID=A0A5M8FIU6_9GAMM|nr:FAD-dependent oxidoreductase [Thiohalocapsa marina]KAA6183656.1 NAD(P)-binding protein [Thiohalocapsa marina]